jgi:hypothetical protein
MIQYLLGQLSEAEQEGLEEKYFADGDVFEQLLGVEDDLIDAYVRGELSPGEREHFERRFLASPRRRERLEFASVLAGSRPTAQPAAAPRAGDRRRASFWQALLSPFQTRNMLLPFSLAAATVIAVAGVSWLALRTRTAPEIPQQVGTAQPEPPPGENPPPRQEPPTLPEPAPTPTPAPRPRVASAPRQRAPMDGSVVSFALEPELVRDIQESKKLRIPPNARSVRLRLELDADEYARYRAVLRTSEGKEVWSQSGLTASAAKSARSVSVSMPAHVLASGEYVLTLSGVAAGGHIEEAADYIFAVEKR